MDRFRRLSLLLAITTMVMATLSGVAGATPSDEADLVALINQSRAGAGLSHLSTNPYLIDYARRHTAEMIGRGDIFHSTSAQLSAVTTGWSLLGENVGMGPNTSLLHSAFLNSPSHRANILGAFHEVGVGAARAADGTLFVTVIFLQQASAPVTTTPAPPTTTTTTVAPTTTTVLPTTTTFAPTTTTAPAPTTTSTTTTTVAPNLPPPPAPAETPVRAIGPRLDRVDSAPKTLALDLPRPLPFVPGTWCVKVRADGSVCVE